MTFTSHYVSINSALVLFFILFFRNLHPTMYLLIRIAATIKDVRYVAFTSHYVSINSARSIISAVYAI